MAESGKEQIETAREDKETTCWGCGSRLHLPTNGAVFRCGWCGAITNHKANKPETHCLGWRRLRDRCFVSILSTFILFVICKFPVPYLLPDCPTPRFYIDDLNSLTRKRRCRHLGGASRYFLSLLHQRDCSFSHNDHLGRDDSFHFRFSGIPQAQIAESSSLPFLWDVYIGYGSPLPFYRELCWRSESSAFHRFPNFSYFEFNLRFGDLCVCEFPYLAAIGIQNPPPLGIIHHSSVDPRDKGSNSGFDKIRHGAFSQGTRSRLPVFCERFGGDQFDRSSMAATVLHLRRPNLSQPFEFSGRRSSGHRERLPEPCTVLRLSMFDFEILAHPAKFAKEAQEVNKFVVLAFLSYTHIYN
ncbi:hypothetical protein V6N12_073070 [Hibiscus sabdariffa]|uniref:Uncharacterized protein n=1 Tax=Hibiscus sabdariffa TaxID=183260 RepID=A0ABR2AQS7_9ROSI